MNPILQARQAYAPGHAAIRSARSVELQIIGDITARLRNAARGGRFADLAAALHGNRRLWYRFAADVADSDNGLPETLRAQLLYLAQFVDIHSRRVLHDGADPSALVEINTAIMRGLGNTGPVSTDPLPTGAAVHTGPADTGPVSTDAANARPVNTGSFRTGPVRPGPVRPGTVRPGTVRPGTVNTDPDSINTGPPGTGRLKTGPPGTAALNTGSLNTGHAPVPS